MVNVGSKRVQAGQGRTGKKAKKAVSKTGAAGVRSFASKGVVVGRPLGNILKAKMRILDVGTLNGGAAGAIAVGTYSLNSLFDPTGSIGARQPRGFDQLALLYGQYRVMKATINVQVANNTGSATAASAAVVAGIFLSPVSTAPGNSELCLENGNCVWNLMPAGQEAKSNLTMAVDCPKFLNRDRNHSDLSAVVTASPAEIIYAHVFVQAVDGATDINPFGYVITIDFEAEFLDCLQLSTS